MYGGLVRAASVNKKTVFVHAETFGAPSLNAEGGSRGPAVSRDGGQRSRQGGSHGDSHTESPRDMQGMHTVRASQRPQKHQNLKGSRNIRILEAPETQKPQKFQEVLIEQSLELFSESGLSAYAGGYDVSVCNQECGRG